MHQRAEDGDAVMWMKKTKCFIKSQPLLIKRQICWVPTQPELETLNSAKFFVEPLEPVYSRVESRCQKLTMQASHLNWFQNSSHKVKSIPWKQERKKITGHGAIMMLRLKCIYTSHKSSSLLAVPFNFLPFFIFYGGVLLWRDYKSWWCFSSSLQMNWISEWKKMYDDGKRSSVASRMIM